MGSEGNDGEQERRKAAKSSIATETECPGDFRNERNSPILKSPCELCDHC